MFASGKKASGAFDSGAFDSHFKANRNVLTGQSINSGSWTKVEFDEEGYDDLNEYDKNTNYRFTADEAGYYSFSASVNIQTLGADKTAKLCFVKNGGTPNVHKLIPTGQTGNVTAGDCNVDTSMDHYLAAGDYIEVFVWHNHGSSRNIVENSVFEGRRFA